MLAELNNMRKTEHEQLSQKITDRILSSDEFKNAETIGLTISRFPEVNTLPLIEAAWTMGKRIAVPRCIRATREMDFRLITSFSSLEAVYIDLLEPIVLETEAVTPEDIDLQIVPGVVYSNDGYRIGFGGGYYDRYIKKYSGVAISIAFESQIGHAVPIENHDISVDKIFTEKRQVTCQKVEKL